LGDLSFDEKLGTLIKWGVVAVFPQKIRGDPSLRRIFIKKSSIYLKFSLKSLKISSKIHDFARFEKKFLDF